MIDNAGLLRRCIANRAIRIADSPVLYRRPTRLPSNFDFHRVEGMLLGLAIGDAWNNDAWRIVQFWGEVKIISGGRDDFEFISP